MEKLILGYLSKNDKIENTEEFCAKNGVSKDDIDPVLKSLNAEDYVVLKVIEKKLIELTEEGLGYAQNGSPEFQFVSAMKMGETVSMADMESRVG